MTCRVMAYIDGFNLFYGIKNKGWKNLYWLDVEKLINNLLKPSQTLAGIKYFTAMVSQTQHDPGKSKRQITYTEALETLPNVTIYKGKYLQKEAKCFSCGAKWTLFEEKMTDVNIAAELLNDAFNNRFDTAMLLSADSDLTRPVDMIVNTFNKRVLCVFPPGRRSKDLDAITRLSSFQIGRAKLMASQFPTQVIKADGCILTRPTSWQ